MTECGSFTIPGMDEDIDSLEDTFKLSIWDASCHYWQVEKDGADSQKLLSPHITHYSNSRACITGLVMHPEHSNRHQRHLIVSQIEMFLGEFGRHYHFSRTANEHIEQICTGVSVPHRTCIMLKFKKCQLFTVETDYLGYLIRPGRLELASHTMEAIRDVKLPQKVTELESFFDLCNDYDALSPTLYRLLPESTRTWTRAQNLWLFV